MTGYKINSVTFVSQTQYESRLAKLQGVKQNNHFPDSHSTLCLLTVWVLSIQWPTNESI